MSLTYPPVQEWVTCPSCGDLTPPLDILSSGDCVTCAEGDSFLINAAAMIAAREVVDGFAAYYASEQSVDIFREYGGEA